MRPRPELALSRKPVLAGAGVYALGVLCAVALAWSHWSEVDVVVRAPGVVRPEGDLVRVISESAGAVVSVGASEGDRVQTGDVLVRLDGREPRLEGKALEWQIVLGQTQLADIDSKIRDAAAVHAVELRKLDAEIAAARESLDRRRREHAAGLRAAELQTVRARDAYALGARLAAAGLGSRQALEGLRADLLLAEVRRAEIAEGRPEAHALDPLLADRELARALFEARRGELAAAVPGIEAHLADLRLRRERSARAEARRVIRSPTDGRLTFVTPLHPGEHLAAGTLVAAVVPEAAPLVVEAQVPNRDAEHIEAGQAARLILDASTAFDGAVLSISPDAGLDESRAGAYRVLVRPGAGEFRLGLALQVRVLTGRRSVLELLLARVRRAFE
jgi:adhesin transport system membrane fusion protein